MKVHQNRPKDKMTCGYWGVILTMATPTPLVLRTEGRDTTFVVRHVAPEFAQVVYNVTSEKINYFNRRTYLLIGHLEADRNK